jgi:uncharacterized membrane protein
MRYVQLDFTRGVAIVLMVIFHFSFDLNNFHFINTDIYHGVFWQYFRFLILTIFLLCVGISLSITHKKQINIKKVFKRFFILLLLASFVSIASFITFANTWIYFGVLHFIAISSILALIFLRLTWLNLFLGVTIIALFFLDIINMHWLYNILQSPLHLPKYTEDLVPLFPWFGIILIGLFIGKKELYLFPLKESYITQKIAYLGKHSLLIYMAHQPLLFGLTAGADYLLH